MYKKRLLFGDKQSAEEVLLTDDPERQQAIGRNAKGYNRLLWEGARQAIALRGILAKFEQNEDLKNRLLETGDDYLVECAGKDMIWACGIRINDEDRHDASKWKGNKHSRLFIDGSKKHY